MSTDWHIKKENSDEILELIREKLILAKGLGLKVAYVAGDIFVSRVSQRMEILDSFWDILNLAKEYDIILYIIPGNHDKTDYKSDRSFLRFYKHHPNLVLVENYLSVVDGDFEIHMMPFFDHDCEKFNENFSKCCTPKHKDKKQILISHFAVQGSINNDGTKIDKGSSVSEFKCFHMVFLGHYHNMHNIGDNIMHIPSLRQNNFGENEDKGFTIVYDDDVIELYSPEFTRYKKVNIDLSEINFNDLLLELKKYEEVAKDSNIRFIISGNEEEVRSLDASIFTDIGIDVKKNIKNLVPKLVDIPIIEEVVEWNESDILSRFKLFCDSKDLDHEQGIKLLEEIILHDR